MKRGKFATTHVWQRLFIVSCLLWSAVANSSRFTFHASLIKAQTFTLETQSDTLHYVILITDSTTSRWRLPYPVYRFDTGDVDGDGSTDALVGVEKATRYYPYGRRLFIFKNYKGHVRPLWMGSKLGGDLQDFRFTDGRVRSLETFTNGQYAVGEWEWSGFGLRFLHFLLKGADRKEAEEILNNDN